MCCNFAHLEQIRISYCAHFARAFQISLRLLGAGMAAMVHAVYPDVFEKTASNTVKALHKEFTSANEADEADEADEPNANKAAKKTKPAAHGETRNELP